MKLDIGQRCLQSMSMSLSMRVCVPLVVWSKEKMKKNGMKECVQV